MRRMTIEQALRWAYVDELPKDHGRRLDAAAFGLRGGWDAVAEFGAHMALVDTTPYPLNAYGLAPDYSAADGPHPDAVRIHEAVVALDDQCAVIPAGWYPLDDMGDLGALGIEAVERGLSRVAPVGAGGVRVARTKASALIRKHAILGGTPEWRGELPERKPVMENGKAKWFVRDRIQIAPAEPQKGIAAQYMDVEVDGRDKVSRRPIAGAYRKWALDPDPAPVVESRAEYELWRWALDMLCGELAGGLSDVAVTGVGAPERPWRP